MISVGIIEDDTDIREGVVTYLRLQKDLVCTISEGSVEEFFVALRDGIPPEVVLLDIGLPGISGIQAIRFLKEKLPAAEILMFTVHDEPNKVFQALCAGASGYLLKNTPLPKIHEAVVQTAAGGAAMSPQIARRVIESFARGKPAAVESPLSEREREIVTALVDGLSYKQIADRTGISIDTVRHHIKNIYRKLQVGNKAEVIAMSLRGEI
jgi:DNA-binding NarL/FixJ family response regulator